MQAITSGHWHDADASYSLLDRAIYRRAVEAAIWGMPLVNFDAMRQAYFRDAGARYNDVIYWSKPSDWKNRTTTPTHSTSYCLFFANLKNGPIVVDIPPTDQSWLYGSLIDSWNIPLINVGSQGEDKGKGARYLLLPPGYQGQHPRELIAISSRTYNIYGLLRIITDAYSSLRKLRIHPLLQVGAPVANRFIDMADQIFDGLPRFDSSFYKSLARMVDEEPVLEHNLSMMGQLCTLNIGKDLDFHPSLLMRSILEHAIDEAHAYMMEGYASTGELWWEAERRWHTPTPTKLANDTGLSFVEPDRRVWLDERAFAWFGTFGPSVPPGGLFYLKSFETHSGERLFGSNIYRLHVSKNVPVRQFWAIDVYDATTGAFIREAPVVGIDSYDRNLRKNTDGSVDIYFSPFPPYGKDSNWIATAEGHPFFVIFRFYGPETSVLDRRWILNDLEMVT